MIRSIALRSRAFHMAILATAAVLIAPDSRLFAGVLCDYRFQAKCAVQEVREEVTCVLTKLTHGRLCSDHTRDGLGIDCYRYRCNKGGCESYDDDCYQDPGCDEYSEYSKTDRISRNSTSSRSLFSRNRSGNNSSVAKSQSTGSSRFSGGKNRGGGLLASIGKFGKGERNSDNRLFDRLNRRHSRNDGDSDDDAESSTTTSTPVASAVSPKNSSQTSSTTTASSTTASTTSTKTTTASKPLANVIKNVVGKKANGSESSASSATSSSSKGGAIGSVVSSTIGNLFPLNRGGSNSSSESSSTSSILGGNHCDTDPFCGWKPQCGDCGGLIRDLLCFEVKLVDRLLCKPLKCWDLCDIIPRSGCDRDWHLFDPCRWRSWFDCHPNDCWWHCCHHNHDCDPDPPCSSVPEPASLTLVGMALVLGAGAGFSKRRRKEQISGTESAGQ